MFDSLLMGLAVGAVGGIPVGPLGALALEQRLARKPRAALGTGFGAALGMGAYGFVGVVLARSVEGWITANAPYLQAGVGLLFLWLAFGAYRRLRAIPAEASHGGSAGLVSAAGDSFPKAAVDSGVLAALRPTTALIVAGLVASLFGGKAVAVPAAFALGAVATNLLWFVVLAFVGGVLREKVSARGLFALRATLVGVIGLFGLGFLVKAIVGVARPLA